MSTKLDAEQRIPESALRQRWAITDRQMRRIRDEGDLPYVAIGHQRLYCLADVAAYERRNLRGGDAR